MCVYKYMCYQCTPESSDVENKLQSKIVYSHEKQHKPVQDTTRQMIYSKNLIILI